MKTIRRESNQESVREEIKFFAWHQIATGGVGSISLGAIARSMNLTTPALYRYFPSRDHLILALTLDAYKSFVASLEAVSGEQNHENHAARFHALCKAYYQWAVDHPQQYQLIFGFALSPYELNEEAGEMADRSFLIVIEMINDACRAGKIAAVNDLIISAELKNRLERLSHRGKTYPAEVMYLALGTWSFINGITTLELSQKYSLMLAHQTHEFFTLEVDRYMRSIGFSS